MSWNKNTIVASEIDSVIRTLDDCKASYDLTTLGEVTAMGLNDDYNGINRYPVRRLEYQNTVILEQMQRTHDCDMDDCLVSCRFKKGEEPKDWKLEIFDDCEDFNCGCRSE